MSAQYSKSKSHSKLEFKEDPTIWDKIGTIGRKKKIKEVQSIHDEGKYSIEAPGDVKLHDLPQEYYNLEPGEEKSFVEPHSYNDPKFVELRNILIKWLNNILSSQRIIVRNLEDDLYDGHILHKLIEKLAEIKINLPEVSQSAESQRQKLCVVIDKANELMNADGNQRTLWSALSINDRNILSVVHLLVAIARYWRAPIRIPENVVIKVAVVSRGTHKMNYRVVDERLTCSYDDLGLKHDRDVFDNLLEFESHKLPVVADSFRTFVNKHLSKLHLQISDIKSGLSDGVNLCLLMGLLEGYFVPLYELQLTPHTFEAKVHNVTLAFHLMHEAGFPAPRPRPEDVVNCDMKSILRILYNIYEKYKHVP